MYIDTDNNETQTLPLLALRGTVLFPGTVMHFDVARDISIKAVEHALEDGVPLFVVAQRDIRTEEPETGDLYPVGTVARVKQMLKMPDGSVKVLARGSYRAKLLLSHDTDEMLMGVVQRWDLPKLRRVSPTLTARMRAAKAYFEDFAYTGGRSEAKDVMVTVMAEDDPEKLVQHICANALIPYEDKQDILEQSTVLRQLDGVITTLEREIRVAQIQQEIYDKVKEQMDQNQREFVLREHMRVISEELGEDDGSSELEDLYNAILALDCPEETREHLLKNYGRLAKMPLASQEANVIQTYLETCLELPWNNKSKIKINISAARKVLDRDHYGLQKVKERVLEFIAVHKIAPKTSGQILCLVGPPGVGKTSIAKSIAEAMGREYVRISLGGVHDESEIRGHRKTYIGSMPGRIIKAMTQAGTQNPLILLDEVDKLGNDYKGDPTSALLEVLDKEQNNSFRDHYIEVPYDLSDVLFLTSANDASQIPGPLYDRMEVIELGSYTEIEKFNIAKRHLIPKQIKLHGLTASQMRFNQDAIFELIDGYTREAGVRNLEREIASLCRKTAKLLVSGEKKSVTITTAMLKTMLGHRKYDRDDKMLANKIGKVNGLAWTSVGGTTLPIEVTILEGTGKIQLTGSLGNVMKESASIAVSYVRSVADLYGIPQNFYKNKDIHIHAPQGAVPKDGPSAGVTMVTALISALTDIPVRGNVAMTGEIDLHGDVMPIGGLKEKSMAAYKNKFATVIIPARNVPDLEEVDKEVKEGLAFKSVESISEVLELALVEMPESAEKPVKKTSGSKKSSQRGSRARL